MKGLSLGLSLAVLVAILVPSAAPAQLWQAGAPGEDVLSARLYLGVLQPLTDYADGSSLETGASFGVGGSYWPTRYLGLTADVFRSQNEVATGSGFSALADQDPTVWLYNLSAALRVPIVTGNLALAPYIAGGPTAKSYKWAVYQPQMGGLFDRPYGGGRNTSFGWSYGGGLEIRLGQSGNFGIVADARSIRSDFDWFGLRTDQSDMMFTGGITIHR